MAQSSKRPLGCRLCGGSPAAQRGMEMTLRRQHLGRLVLRESDGLIPLCDACLTLLVVERPRPVWPFLAVGSAVLLLLRGNWLIASVVLLAGLAGVVAAVRRPSQRAARLGLRSQALEFSSAPLAGYEAADVSEVVLERRIAVRYNEDGTVEAKVLGSTA